MMSGYMLQYRHMDVVNVDYKRDEEDKRVRKERKEAEKAEERAGTFVRWKVYKILKSDFETVEVAGRLMNDEILNPYLARFAEQPWTATHAKVFFIDSQNWEQIVGRNREISNLVRGELYPSIVDQRRTVEWVTENTISKSFFSQGT